LDENPNQLWRRLLAEYLGSALLALIVIGSGIAAQQLSPNDVGLELLEYRMEDRRPDPRMTGLDWHDNFMVARAPVFEDPAAEQAHYARLAAIVATPTTMPEFGPDTRGGPAVDLYEQRRTAVCPGPPQPAVSPTRTWMRAMVADARSRARTLVRR